MSCGVPYTTVGQMHGVWGDRLSISTCNLARNFLGFHPASINDKSVFSGWVRWPDGANFKSKFKNDESKSHTVNLKT